MQVCPNRWLIAVMGTALQLCLGTVYAWSFFQKPLVEKYSWTDPEVTWIFSLAIFFLGLASAWGGNWLNKLGPVKMTIMGGLLFGSGYLVSALALKWHSLPLLYFGYGIMGGIGLGLGYVTPVTTVAKWFPDKKGFATGMVIMGFGFGAVLMSKVIAPLLIAHTQGDLSRVFGILGVVFTLAIVGISFFLRNPPDESTGAKSASNPSISNNPSLVWNSPLHAIRSKTFVVMWLIFFCNIAAGISIIGFQSPLLQDLLRAHNPALSSSDLASHGATLIAISSISNGIGRIFWGSISDRIGCALTFRIMLGTQIAVFLSLMFVSNPLIFGLLVCYILLCYGGGFGTMPSYVLSIFGKRLMPVVYGAILTAWSTAGIVGPQIVAHMKVISASKAGYYSFASAAVFLSIGFLLNLFFSPKGAESVR